MEIKRNQPHVKLLIPKAVEPLQKLDYRAATTSKKLHDVSKSLKGLREGIKKQYLETQGTLIGNILDGNIEETRVQNQLIGALIKEKPEYSSLGGADLSKWLDATKINDVQARKLAILQLMKQNRTLSALLSNSVDQNNIAALIAAKEIEIIAKMERLYRPGGSSSSSSYFPPGGPPGGPGSGPGGPGSGPGSPDPMIKGFQKWAASGFVTKELGKAAELAGKSDTSAAFQQQVSQKPEEVVDALGKVAEARIEEDDAYDFPDEKGWSVTQRANAMEEFVEGVIAKQIKHKELVDYVLNSKTEMVKVAEEILRSEAEKKTDKDELEISILHYNKTNPPDNYKEHMAFMFSLLERIYMADIKARVKNADISLKELSDPKKGKLIDRDYNLTELIKELNKDYFASKTPETPVKPKKDDKGKEKETAKKKEETVSTRTRSTTVSSGDTKGTSSKAAFTKSNPVKKSLKKSQGLGIKIFKNKTDMLRRLKVLIGEIEAGNNSKDVRNEIAQLADRLKAEKVIRPNVYKAIYAKYIN